MIERLQVNLRLDRELVRQLDELAQRARLDRTEMARLILDEGVARHREERALQDYIDGNVTAWRAAELAGISLYDMLDRIHDRHVIHELDPEVLEAIRRLPVPGGPPGEEPIDTERSRRVAEATPVYRSDAVSGIDDLRARYRPTSTRLLFVGESSPAGGTHFYRANSNLFRAVREAFAEALGRDAVPDGEAFLAYFAEQGCWLIDLADEPVNRMADAPRKEAVEAGIDRLRATIAEVRPERIIAIKSSVGYAVRRAADAAESSATVDALPFPVRQWRAAFIERLSALLRGMSTAGTAESPTARGQRADRPAETSGSEPVLTQRVTEADLRRGQIRIPSTGTGKSLFPGVRGRIDVAIRGQRFNAHYDPHYDPDQQRSGVIRIGAQLASLVEAEERLLITRSLDGSLSLDTWTSRPMQARVDLEDKEQVR